MSKFERGNVGLQRGDKKNDFTSAEDVNQTDLADDFIICVHFSSKSCFEIDIV